MNRIFSIVWNRALRMFVVASELASVRQSAGASSGAARVARRSAMFAAFALAGLSSMSAAASDVTNVGFETNTLDGWAAGPSGTQAAGNFSSVGVGASVVTGMTGFDSTSGQDPGLHSWTVTPYGTYMAALQATASEDATQSFTAGAAALLLSSDSTSAITAAMGGAATNAAWIYQDVTLTAGETFTMAWQYVSTDYDPYNDVSVTSLVNVGDSSIIAMVNNELSQYALLGATDLGTGNYATGSYGATGWQIATYTVSVAGTYRLGFLSANLNDTVNSPVLFVDQAPGATYDNGVPFGPIAPNAGSSAPVTPPTPSGPTNIDNQTGTDDISDQGGAFDGGTLTVDNSGPVDQNFTVSDKGGVIDQAGQESTFTGSLTDATSGTPGSITIINTGTGGNVTLTGTNTYTGTTSVDTGATLAIAGGGSIASSSGVTDNGTFDISGANNDVDVTSINGTGNVSLGGNDLVVTGGIGSGLDGSISGTGGLQVSGGTQTLGGENTYTGGTSISGGATLAIVGDGSIAASSGVNDDGALNISGANNDVDVAAINGAGGVILGSNDLIVTDATGPGLDGHIMGTGGVQVSGGTQTLGGYNSYTGHTTVADGATLALSGEGSVSGSSGLTNNGTFDISQANGTEIVTALDGSGVVQLGANDLNIADAAGSYTGTIDGTGGVNITGGTQTLTNNASTYSGGTTVTNNAIVNVATGGALGTGPLTLDNGTLTSTGGVNVTSDIIVGNEGHVDAVGNTVISSTGTVTGSGDFVKDGTGYVYQTGDMSQAGKVIVNDGALELTGNNTYAGDTVVNGGTLIATNDASLGGATSNIAINGGELAFAQSTTSDREISLGGSDAGIYAVSGAVSLNGVISGGAALHLAGDVSLGGSNTYTGGTSVDGSDLTITNTQALGTGNLSIGNGTLHTDIDGTLANNLSLSDTAALDTDGHDITHTGTVTGSGDFIKDGDGTLTQTGALNQNGATVVNDGTLVLSGSNGYTGGTQLNGGTLQVASDASLGAAGSSLAFDGGTLHTTADLTTARDTTITDIARFDVDGGTTTTSTGSVSGSGIVYKDGAGTLNLAGVVSTDAPVGVVEGTLVLGGQNTFTGAAIATTGGTLQISSDGNLGNAANEIALFDGTLHTTASVNTARDMVLMSSGTVDTDAGTTLASSGTVSGDGPLIKNGAGALDIEGVASHTGGTIVNDGTLVLGGNNTYTGGNLLNGGTLQIASDANLGAASNNVTFNGGTLSVTQSNTTARNWVIEAGGATLNTADGVTLQDSGNISGTGGLVKLGGGTLVVSGTNTFTGGTLIDGGIIRIDTGSSLGTGAIILNGGILQTVQTLGTGQQVIVSGNSGVNVDAGTTTVLSGNIVGGSDGGCFMKTGKGKLSLTGSASLGSGTCVQDGILSANGYLDSTFVQVDSIATLRGVGTIVGPVNVDGRLAAGNSPGTLTVQGTVTMNTGSSLEVDIDGTGTANGAGNYSRVLVTGAGNTFVANGTLVPTLRGITGDASNTYTPVIGSTYRIVSAEGGIVGRFAALTQPTDGLAANTRFLAFYGMDDGHSIDLRVAPTSYAQYLGASAKRNDLAAAGALDASVASLDGATDTAAQDTLLYAVSSLPADRIAAMAKSLSGEVHADEAAAARAAGLGMQRDVTDHLSTDMQGADPANRAWANLTRDGNRSVADGQASGFETGTDRSTAGVDLYAEAGTVLGVAVTHHDTNVIAQGGNGSIRGNSGMLYAQQAMGAFVLDGVAAYGSTDWTTRRADPLGGTSLESRTSGNDAMASATLRLPLQTAAGNRIEPYASVIWQKVERDGVQERGASAAALSLDSLSQKGTRVLAGLSMGSKAADPLATTLTWRAGVAVGADTGDLLDPTVHDTLAGQRFDTQAPGVGRGFVQLNANGTMRLGHSTYLYGGVTAEEGQRRSAYGVTAGVRVAF